MANIDTRFGYLTGQAAEAALPKAMHQVIAMYDKSHEGDTSLERVTLREDGSVRDIILKTEKSARGGAQTMTSTFALEDFGLTEKGYKTGPLHYDINDHGNLVGINRGGRGGVNFAKIRSKDRDPESTITRSGMDMLGSVLKPIEVSHSPYIETKPTLLGRAANAWSAATSVVREALPVRAAVPAARP